MPRIARLHLPGVVHHVMSRGIEGRDIFNDDHDRHLFLNMFALEIKRAGFRCYAWVLMKNHYHLLMRTGEQHLGVMMRRLNSGYARYFGKKYNRRGYLFQDRYKSIATQDQQYVEEIVRYIHLNPVRAGACLSVADLDGYCWSGHAAIMGNRNVKFQDTHAVLLRFSKDAETARKKYRIFIEDGLKNASNDSLIETIRKSNKGSMDIYNSGSWVIGDRDFIRTALQADTQSRIRLARYKASGWDMEKLADFVADRMKVDRSRLQFKSKRTSLAAARKVFCYLGYRTLGMPATEIGQFLGISLPAVSTAVNRGEMIAKERKMEIDD